MPGYHTDYCCIVLYKGNGEGEESSVNLDMVRRC